MFFLLWNVRNVKIDLMVNDKNDKIKRKICMEKRINTFLTNLSVALYNHGQHGLLLFLNSLPISVLRN